MKQYKLAPNFHSMTGRTANTQTEMKARQRTASSAVMRFCVPTRMTTKASSRPTPTEIRPWFTIDCNTNRTVRAGANESKKTRNKKQNGLAHSRFIVCVTPKQKKHCLIQESCLSGTCAKQPINNISEVTWLCTWFR